MSSAYSGESSKARWARIATHWIGAAILTAISCTGIVIFVKTIVEAQPLIEARNNEAHVKALKDEITKVVLPNPPSTQVYYTEDNREVTIKDGVAIITGDENHLRNSILSRFRLSDCDCPNCILIRKLAIEKVDSKPKIK